MKRTVDRDLAEALDLAVGLARVQLRQDWPRLRLYGVWDRSVGMTLSRDLWAATSPGMGLVLRDRLARARLWRGPGAAVILNHRVLLEALAGLGRVHRRERAWRLVAGLALHEVSHLVDLGVCLEAPEGERSATAALVAAALTVATPWPADRPPPDHHGLRWLRACIHLHGRAADPAVRLDDVVIDNELYGLSPGDAYVAAGADEVTQLRHLSLREVLAAEPDPKLLDLFTQDELRRQTA